MPDDAMFEYVAWFRDGSLPPDDQDCEWSGVIYIRAGTLAAARKWGDHLAKTCLDTFIGSKAEPFLDEVPPGNPVADDGEELTAGQIGS
ncbi:hypothetical protein [Knoellia koreensis]|uniref:YCII-related domain-containing protein n=1 Tax=Knoellia koreensis TaxID=2730921 RepID=A0A849HE54_9MICO|nr:hypothetical protein [Knoellia sp. DB2414S]NNM45399.1 hypothetical protein [Knoellia sp. DB2414S]